VLSGRQAPALRMILALHRHLGMPAEALLGKSHAAYLFKLGRNGLHFGDAYEAVLLV